MDPVTGGLIAVGLGSLFGGLFSSSSTSSTNSANIQMNRENIQAQKEENALNRQWNSDQVDKQNAYNTPTNQVARLRAAGINPYVAGLDGSGGQMSSPSYSTGLNTQQPNLQSSQIGDFIANGSSQVGNMLFNSSMQRAQVDNMLLSNSLNAQTMGAKIASAYAQAGEHKAAEKISKMNADLSVLTFDDVVAKNHAERQQAEQAYIKSVQETHAVELENKARQINLSWLDREKNAAILEAYSRIRLNGASTKQALASAFAQNNLGKLYQANVKQIEKLLPYMEQDYQQKINLGINQNKLVSNQVGEARTRAAKIGGLMDSQEALNYANAASASANTFKTGEDIWRDIYDNISFVPGAETTEYTEWKNKNGEVKKTRTKTNKSKNRVRRRR